MGRDTKAERALKLGAAGSTRLPRFEVVGQPQGASNWVALRCGRGECRCQESEGIFALRRRDMDKLLKVCPHCFRSGMLPTKEEF